MADTKLTKTKIPTMRPKEKVKHLGLKTQGKRKMVSFRFKHQTIEILDALTEAGKKHFHAKFSYTDTLEMCLGILKDMDKQELIEKGAKYLRERDDDVLTR